MRELEKGQFMVAFARRFSCGPWNSLLREIISSVLTFPMQYIVKHLWLIELYS